MAYEVNFKAIVISSRNIHVCCLPLRTMVVINDSQVIKIVFLFLFFSQWTENAGGISATSR